MEDKISFKGYHIPGLKSGNFAITSNVVFKSPRISNTTFNSSALNIFVAGPRFIFAPKEIYAVFPPRDSFGEHDNVLPHIELESSSLPWMRKTGAADDKLPWLALILLQEEEWGDEKKKKKADDKKVIVGKQTWEKYRKRVNSGNLDSEITDSPEKGKEFPPLKILDIEPEFLKKILPSAEELKNLTHIRVGHSPTGEEVERAVLVCNRIPKAGARAAVHLVSLEGRLGSNGEFDLKLGLENEKVPLLSIHSWEFSCPDDEQFEINKKTEQRLPQSLKTKLGSKIKVNEVLKNEALENNFLYRGGKAFKAALRDFTDAEKATLKGFSPAKKATLKDFIDIKNPALIDFTASEKVKLTNICHVQTETFKGLMDALDLKWTHIPTPDGISGSAEKFFDIGSVPLAHGLRQGGKTVSWYRGPLIADRNLSEATEKELLKKLPIRTADHLLMYNKVTSMLDTSYAAAWEIGRLLSISEPRISQQIAQWKTSHAREIALVEQNLVFSHIPFTDSAFLHEQGGLIEKKLQQYFTDLSYLKGVPFQYLVPHESFLPDESMRFFYIDPLWVECLLDGAFSIGRTTKYDQEREKDAEGNLVFPHKSKRPPMTGILLRSDLVSGWPSLIIEAYEKNKKTKALPILRFERLGPNVLIVIFEGEINELRLHLPPESLHFGFNRPIEEGGHYFKELKNLKTGEEIEEKIEKGENKSRKVDITFREDISLRVVDIAKLKSDINKKLPGLKIKHSGHLAIELIEGVPSLEIRIND